MNDKEAYYSIGRVYNNQMYEIFNPERDVGV